MNDETKRCPKCEQQLALIEFNRRANGRWSPYCKPCMSAYCKAHYAKNAVAHNARRVKADVDYQARNRELVRCYLASHVCIDCGDARPNVLEFDTNDLSRPSVMYLAGRGVGLDVMQREIDRCVVRCASCARRRTARQIGRADGISLLPGCSSAW